MTSTLPPAGRPWLPLAAVIATVSVYAIAQGLTYPLLSFILERQGHSPAAIGLSAAMTPIGFICCAPFVPALTRRWDARRTVLVSAFGAAVILALIGWTRGLVPWFPLRFLLGVTVLPLYIISEVWIISLAPPERRGRVMGVYTSVISGGFALGPLSLIAVGTEGWPPFLVGLGAFLACGLGLILIGSRMPRLAGEKGHASVGGFLRLAPALLAAVFITAVLEQTSLSLLPVYGLGHGLGESDMSALIAVLIAGNAALQVPFGMAAERWSARSLLIACAAGSALGAALIPVLIATPLIWPLVFVWGATCFGIYTAALIMLAARFSGAMLVAGNAAFSMLWGIGGIAGPSVTGAAMNLFGDEALPATLALACLALALVQARKR